MEKGMVVVKESFWKRIKNFFSNLVKSRKNASVTKNDEKLFNELDKSFKSNKEVEEGKIVYLSKALENLEKATEAEEIAPKVTEKAINERHKDVTVNGKNIRCYETSNAEKHTKRYICMGENEASFSKTQDAVVKNFIEYGYREYDQDTFGYNYKERIREKKLDKVMTKTTYSKTNVTEEFQSYPLKGVEDDEYKGRYEKKETIQPNGNRQIEETHQITDNEGNQHVILETFFHTKDGYTQTKYIDGKACFQLIRDVNGTLIKDYDDNGNVKDAYQYDKSGNPIERISSPDENGSLKRTPKIYAGIDKIPDDMSISERLKSKSHLNYDTIIMKAGIPENIQTILENVYVERIKDKAFNDIEQAKKILTNIEHNEEKVASVSDSMER